MGGTATKRIKGGEDQRAEARKRATDMANSICQKLLAEKAPDLVAKKEGAGLSKAICTEIWGEVQGRVPKADLVKVRKAFRKRLKELEAATGGKVVLPPPVVAIARDQSPFADKAIELSTQLCTFLEVFWSDLKEGISFDPDAARFDSLVKRFKGQDPEVVIARRTRTLTIGRIVFSAIVNGGMLHTKLYLQLPKMLCNHLQAHEHHAWVSFPLQRPNPKSDEAHLYDPNDPDQPVRRWFLDPVTLGLVTRWRLDQSIEECQTDVAQVKTADALKAYLSYLNAQVRDGPGQCKVPCLTTKSLFEAAGARLSLYLPQILVRYLTSITEGSSMSERSWWRYIDDLQIQYTPAQQGDVELVQAAIDAPEIEQKFAGNKAQFFEMQESLIKLLNQCLSDPAKPGKKADNHVAAKDIQKVLDVRQPDMAPILNAWYRWVLWKLTRASRAQGKIESVSAIRYTSRLGSALIEVGAEVAIDGGGSSDWEEFYQDVLDSIESDNERAAAVGNLMQFHEFMMAAYDLPPATIEGQSGTGSRPRICVVNDKDYERLMEVLDNGGEPTHRHKMLRLIAMLMYRVGLRPREIIGLEYRLIHGASRESLKDGTAYPVLYLRITSQEDLKTTSAVRQIPLTWFLTPEEMDEFNQYLAQRLRAYREKDQRSMLILSTARNNNEPLNQNEMLTTLTQLLRSITGDPAVVAYSLRHSCFTHLLAALFLLNPKKKDRPGSRLLRNGHLPREVVYAISNLAGHLDPVMTLQFYIHIQDLVAHEILSRMQADLPLAVWSTLEGVSDASIEQRRRRQALARPQKQKAAEVDEDEKKALRWKDNARQLIRKLKCPMPNTQPGKDVPIPALEFPERSLLDLDMDDINALLMSGHRSHSDQARAEFFDLPVNQVSDFIKHSKSLAAEVSAPYSVKKDLRKKEYLREKKYFRNLKRKDWEQLPEIYRRPQPGEMGPAPPNTRRERAEADRIYKLLGSRAIGLNLEPEAVRNEILDPVRSLLTAQARSESVIRATSEEQFVSHIKTLRDLRIDQARIELAIESLPLFEPVNAEQWLKHLRKLAGSRKLPTADGHDNLTRRSRHYPDFGIVKIRVLELAAPEAGELRSEVRDKVGMRAGAGWRVGCFYVCAALAALMKLPPNWIGEPN